MPSPYSKSRTRYIPVYRYSMCGALHSQQPSQSLIVYHYPRAMTGNLLPKWRQIIRQGGNATTGFSANENTLEVEYPYMNSSYRKETSPNVWELHRDHDSSFSNWFNLSPLGVHYSSAVEQEANARAVALLYKRIYKARHQLQGGVILGEAHKTAKLLFGATKRFKQTVAQTMTGMVKVRNQVKLSKAAVRRKALSNAYLEGSFGWRPLIKDAEDLAITLARIILNKDRLRFRVGAESEKSISHGMSELVYCSFFCNSVTTEKTIAQVFYAGFLQGSVYQGGVAPLQRIISLSGFDLGSFIPNLWELLPYSWLIDYFTNVGDVLYAMSVDTSMAYGIRKTVRITSTREYLLTPNIAKSQKDLSGRPGIKNVVTTGQAGRYVIKYHTVLRLPSEVPYLMPQLKGIDLRWDQMANIAALFTR
jgi:hypothetical protein